MISRLFGAARVQRRLIGRRPLFMLQQLKETLGCSIGIIAGPQRILNWMCRDDDICVPWWIDAELDIEKALDCADRPKSLKDDLRRIRKNNLGFKLSMSLEDFKFFYERIYMPTITTSHGASALSSCYQERCAEIRAGKAKLMFVTKDGKPIGGVLLDYQNEIPALRDIGILDSNKELLKTGVITAAYFFAMQTLKKNGYNKVCLGLSRSFLNDGVLTFKQKWRPTLIETSQESFLIRVSRLSMASRSFLRSSSYIAGDEGDFHFAFFAANDDDVQSNRCQLGRLSAIYGIDSSSNIDLSGQRPIMRRAS